VLSRVPERKMQWVRTGLLIAWFVLIASLLWDPLTPWLTEPGHTGSPFHLGETPVVVQGKIVGAEPYRMGNRIFWTMALPLIPIAIMLFGHETWRRICPLSHLSQIPRMLGWEPKIKRLNRKSGQIDRALRLLPSQSWLRRNHLYFQFGFLALGVAGRILFYNSDRIALIAAFAFIMILVFLVGLLYGGKTWCNYFCPTAVIQAIYTGPGGLFDSKAHIARVPVSQSMCRASNNDGDKSICVACMTNCPDVDLENSYWKSVDSEQKRFAYYAFFGLVFAFYTYYFVYSGSWTYYMSGVWTHESDQLEKLFAPGFFLGGIAVPIPKFIAVPLYISVCTAASFWLFVFAERGYAHFTARRGGAISKVQLRHRMLTVAAFLSFNLFYLFAGRPNIFLMPPWAIKFIDVLIIFVSVAWLFQTLARDADKYRRENLALTLRAQLVRMGFRSEDLLEGKPIDKLTADEVYVLAKTLPNFSIAQKRDAYRGVLTEALETGQTKYAESLKLLSDFRSQLGLSDADHEAIAQALGIEDPSLFDSELARSVEQRVRHDNYKQFLLNLVEQGLAANVMPATYLASAQALETEKQVRALYSISDDDHARIVDEITGDKSQLVGRSQKLSDALRQLEVARFTLTRDKRPEALLLGHAVLSRQKHIIREIVKLAVSIGDHQIASALAQEIDVLVCKEAHAALMEAIETTPENIRDAFLRMVTSDPVSWSYLEVIAALKPADEVFCDFASDHDPIVAAVAISAVSRSDRADADRISVELLARMDQHSQFVDEVLLNVQRGEPPTSIMIMAELLFAKVFAALELSTLSQIAGNSKLVTFSAGDQICRIGEVSDSMFVLVRGETVTWVDDGLERMVLGQSAAGAVFGELGVITGRPRSASIEVISPNATAVEIPRKVIDELLGRDLQAVRGILNVVSGYLLDNLSAKSARSPRHQVNEEPAVAL
jgi:CRP-like cAMP-binding protein